MDIENDPDVYVIDASGFLPRRLTQDPATDQAPSWSADGQWIYFASVRSGVWQIWKMASGGGEPIQVTRDGGFTAYATDDGQWLYYSRSTHGGLWRIPAVGGDAAIAPAGSQRGCPPGGTRLESYVSEEVGQSFERRGVYGYSRLISTSALAAVAAEPDQICPSVVVTRRVQ